METALSATIRRPELVPSSPALKTETGRGLAVAVVYHLSEAGRKASLLQGGNGHTVQRLHVDVPVNRLHLVAVSARGEARLRITPRFERDDDERVQRIDEPPTYDEPPTIEQLFRDAARNHELERAYEAERSARLVKRRDSNREWRSQVAEAFLADPSQRAMVHPSPSSTRCVLLTARGREQFDARDEVLRFREVPIEAHRRFRADLQNARAQLDRDRAEWQRLHDTRKQAVAEWIRAHGTADQQARHAAGLLAMDEAVAAMTDRVFAPLSGYARYERDGGKCLEVFLRQLPRYADAVVMPTEFKSDGRKATAATTEQWTALQKMQAAVPDAVVALHVRELRWLLEPKSPRLVQHTFVVTLQAGPLVLRREYHAPSA